MTGLVADADSGPLLFACNRVVIATGGVGGLYQYGTNPAGSFGQGLAIAARAGALMGDLEFVQFHPTALDDGASPLKLVSETVRGEGAILIDERGERFMADVEGAELAPRDVVARAVHAQLAAGHRVFLDARQAIGARFAQRFPAITGFCRAAGIDPATQPIPVRPAAHYHMGGVRSILPDAPRSKGFGPAARRPARACTAPTGSPAIRCSRPSFAVVSSLKALPRQARRAAAT